MTKEYTINNGCLSATVMTYGATLKRLYYMGTNVVLGYSSKDEYVNATCYVGATVGRYANRISGGSFRLDGTEYRLACNENGINHLHGGNIGADKKEWEVTSCDKTQVTLSVLFKDGEEGYPGNLTVSVTYRLNKNSLEIIYHAVSDKATICNITNHSYFNLDGEGDVLSHTLAVSADCITEVDENLIPTGALMPVVGTPFDLNQPRVIGDVLNSRHSQLSVAGGLDHNFCLTGAAYLFSPKSGILLTCKTDMPGLQVYTANFLKNAGGEPDLYKGVCLETQFYPDSPNHKQFPCCVLEAGKEFISKTVYTFDKKK